MYPAFVGVHRGCGGEDDGRAGLSIWSSHGPVHSSACRVCLPLTWAFSQRGSDSTLPRTLDLALHFQSGAAPDGCSLPSFPFRTWSQNRELEPGDNKSLFTSLLSQRTRLLSACLPATGGRCWLPSVSCPAPGRWRVPWRGDAARLDH